MRFQHIGQAGLELLTSSDPPSSASQSDENTVMRHRAQPYLMIFELKAREEEEGVVLFAFVSLFLSEKLL